MDYEIHGIHKETGKQAVFSVEATSEDDAIGIASDMGFATESIQPVYSTNSLRDGPLFAPSSNSETHRPNSDTHQSSPIAYRPQNSARRTGIQLLTSAGLLAFASISGFLVADWYRPHAYRSFTELMLQDGKALALVPLAYYALIIFSSLAGLASLVCSTIAVIAISKSIR